MSSFFMTNLVIDTGSSEWMDVVGVITWKKGG
jgi:hypothetical protein